VRQRNPVERSQYCFVGFLLGTHPFWNEKGAAPEKSKRRASLQSKDHIRIDKLARTLMVRKELSIEDALKLVWRQALIEGAKEVTVGGASYAVTVLKAKRLRQVYFKVGDAEIVAVEQNPNTKSRWAEMARAGKKVMQFMQDNRYFAVVADGKCILYGSGTAS
jgi:hypothetical protein